MVWLHALGFWYIEQFVTGASFTLPLAVTRNIEETAFDFMDHYGFGHTYHFSVTNYEHTGSLASNLYWILNGFKPSMNILNSLQFKDEEKLYHYLHLRDVEPAL